MGQEISSLLYIPAISSWIAKPGVSVIQSQQRNFHLRTFIKKQSDLRQSEHQNNMDILLAAAKVFPSELA